MKKMLLYLLLIIFGALLCSCNKMSEKEQIIITETPKTQIEKFTGFSYKEYEQKKSYYPCFSYGYSTYNNYMPYSFEIDENTKLYGFMDMEFNILSEPIYDNPSIFSNGLACVSVGNMYSLINQSFDYVMEAPIFPFKYNQNWYKVKVFEPNSDSFTDDMPVKYICFDNQEYLGIDLNELLVPFRDLENRIPHWGYKYFLDAFDEDKKDEYSYIIEPVYEEAREFHNGLAAVKSEGKWGFINTEGEVIVEIKYDKVEDFSEGYAFVANFSNISYGVGHYLEWGMIDNKGKLMTDMQYSNVKPFQNGFALVSRSYNMLNSDSFIFLNGKGEEIFGNNVFSRSRFIDGIALVLGTRGYYYIDESGENINNTYYSMAKPFSEGYAAVKADGKWGFINSSGSLILDPIYSQANSFKSGFALVYTNGISILSRDSFLIDKAGVQYLSELDIAKISYFNDNGYALAYSELLIGREIYKRYYMIHVETELEYVNQ